jgi:predicted  nucleic acid-binding Zn-ribbon protein
MSGPHLATLAQLVDLDALDQELLALRAEQAKTPVGLAARKAEIGSAGEARDAIAQRLASHGARQRELERELEGVEKRAQRARDRLPVLSTSEQIAATEREILHLGEQRDEHEFAILEEMEQVDVLKAQLSSADEALARANASLSQDSEAWSARSAAVAARVTELEAAIAALTPQIAHDGYKAYRIGFENRNNRNHIGVTRTDGIMCVQCRTEVPARWVNEARRGEGIHRCPGCKRVLVGAAPKADTDDDGAPAP